MTKLRLWQSNPGRGPGLKVETALNHQAIATEGVLRGSVGPPERQSTINGRHRRREVGPP